MLHWASSFFFGVAGLSFESLKVQWPNKPISPLNQRERIDYADLDLDLERIRTACIDRDGMSLSGVRVAGVSLQWLRTAAL